MYARLSRLPLVLALVGGLLAIPCLARAQDTEVVIEWNRLLQTTLATPGALPPTVFFTRPYALMHVAIFDALNSIDYLYTEYATRAEAPPGASREAAAAQAAHDVLVAQFPNQSGTFDAALAATLSRLPSGPAAAGARVGATVARTILELRRDDGWNRVPPPFLLPDLPGYYQVAPPQNAPAAYTHYPDVQPFIIGSAHQFLVEPPPALTSERYAADFNDVKEIGGTTSRTRTPDQTLVARLWASVGTPTTAPGIWNNLVRDLARSSGLNGLDTARLYALLNVNFHDGVLATMTGKYLYALWRPVTAIRAADRDGNPATEADPTWSTLIPTPPYPSYPGNQACLGATASQLLTRAFGRDNIPFTLTWTATDGSNVTRSYNGFRQAADEEARSRIYGGIHYTFDTTASFGVCTRLADYVFENALRPRFTTR